MPAFLAGGGMPFWIDLMTTDIRKASSFYAQVAGWDIKEISADRRLARVAGMPVAGIVQQPEDAQLPDTWVLYFLADDLDAQVEEVNSLGGRVLAPPTEISTGRMALLVDAAGAIFGLIEPTTEEAFIAAGEPGTPVWHELTAISDYPRAVEFYSALLEWDFRSLEGVPGMNYTTALAEGAPFAGIWDAAGAFDQSLPNFWQSYIGVADIDAAVAAAAEKGEVIREPWESEFGRMALVADPMGAVVTLCQVDPPVEEGHEGDPLAGVDLSEYGIS